MPRLSNLLQKKNRSVTLLFSKVSTRRQSAKKEVIFYQFEFVGVQAQIGKKQATEPNRLGFGSVYLFCLRDPSLTLRMTGLLVVERLFRQSEQKCYASVFFRLNPFKVFKKSAEVAVYGIKAYPLLHNFRTCFFGAVRKRISYIRI